MNITKLFETQKKLDGRIVVKKGLQGVDLLDKKILALLTELGELANEWQMFKFWKENPKPNDKRLAKFGYTNKLGDEIPPEYSNPLLEEYVDNLHFILSIGNESRTFRDFDVLIVYKTKDVTSQFNHIFGCISSFAEVKEAFAYKDILSSFMGLGEMLGFTTEQIEQAYYDKNKINHERQESGY